MRYISRTTSIITGKSNLEPLYTFKDFPVFMGCADEVESKDIRADMSFSICRDAGIIQLDKLLPLNVVYQNQHNDGVGRIWHDHYEAFSQFLEKFDPIRILEIGGANNIIANHFLHRNPFSRWIIVEPHPLFNENNKIRIIKQWFNDSFTLDEHVDTIVHSHVIEHMYDPISFIVHIAKHLKAGGKHIFTLPNMVEMLSKKYTNCLNFEHTTFLAEPFIDYILSKNGFKIVKKKYFYDHSIFYATVRMRNLTTKEIDIPRYYSQYKKLFTNFISYHKNLVNSISNKMDGFEGEIYLFGAHIFSQYLLEFGLKKEKISAILDNSFFKQGKRLYGTHLHVQSPEVLRTKKIAGVVLKVGIYRNEIVNQLMEINPKIYLLE